MWELVCECMWHLRCVSSAVGAGTGGLVYLRCVFCVWCGVPHVCAVYVLYVFVLSVCVCEWVGEELCECARGMHSLEANKKLGLMSVVRVCFHSVLPWDVQASLA